MQDRPQDGQPIRCKIRDEETVCKGIYISKSRYRQAQDIIEYTEYEGNVCENEYDFFNVVEKWWDIDEDESTTQIKVICENEKDKELIESILSNTKEIYQKISVKVEKK